MTRTKHIIAVLTLLLAVLGSTPLAADCGYYDSISSDWNNLLLKQNRNKADYGPARQLISENIEHATWLIKHNWMTSFAPEILLNLGRLDVALSLNQNKLCEKYIQALAQSWNNLANECRREDKKCMK